MAESSGLEPGTVVLATDNPGKLREFEDLLGSDVRWISQAALGIEGIEETGASFLENALLKARHAAKMSGLPAIADDSGLEVDALDGQPGVRSARYAGANADAEANIAKLLRALAETAPPTRNARFRCVVVYVRHAADREPIVAEGVWEGAIAHAPTGRRGFGYDPVFVDRATGLTAAQLDPAEKNARSHRGQALRALRRRLAADPAPA